MIKLNITGERYELNDKIKDYVNNKIGKLDKYLPKGERSVSHGEVVLSEEDGRAQNRFTAEVVIRFPHGVVTAKESTINMYAAVDIIEEKVKSQILKHKDKTQNNRRRRRSRRMIKGFMFWQSPEDGEK